MSRLTIDMLNGEPIPKRGDLIQSAVGTGRERTWFVIQSRALKPTKGVPRAKIWVERWFQIEPELRVKLFLSAERNGGQRVIDFKRYPAKKRKSFEQYMIAE